MNNTLIILITVAVINVLALFVTAMIVWYIWKETLKFHRNARNEFENELNSVFGWDSSSYEIKQKFKSIDETIKGLQELGNLPIIKQAMKEKKIAEAERELESMKR